MPETGSNKRGFARAAILVLGLVSLLSACAVPDKTAPLTVPAKGARLEPIVFLSSKGPVQDGAAFAIPFVGAREVVLTLQTLDERTMSARISCDGPGRLRVGDDDLYLRPGGSQFFTLPNRHAPQVKVRLTPEVAACTLTWGDGNSMELVRDDIANPALVALDTRREACVVPPAGSLDRLAQVFYANTDLSQTCATHTGRVDFAQDPIDALNARFEALTGRKVSRAALLAGDPDMPIDFSRAPKLDLIVVSYLHVRADLSGYLAERMIEYHAARGTRVRILATGSLMQEKDRLLWERLAARYPNVEIQYFQWGPQSTVIPSGFVDTLQRTNHTKFFLTLSPQPGRSRFIIGGRNLHDGFFFENAFDLSSHPELRTYTNGGLQGLAWHTVYEDFEIVMHDDQAVRDIATHFATLWQRDTAGGVVRPMTRPGRIGSVPADGVERHFLSIPYSDGKAMETYYVSMIDAARYEIVLTSPFLYPTPAIEAALVRARGRGVRVVLISRINSTDPPGFFTTALIHDFLNRHVGDFEMWNYEREEHLMHTKILVIDDRLGVVASTNINGRSFLHDTENGVTFLDRRMAARLKAVTQGYIARGERITGVLQTKPLAQTVGGIGWLMQYF